AVDGRTGHSKTGGSEGTVGDEVEETLKMKKENTTLRNAGAALAIILASIVTTHAQQPLSTWLSDSERARFETLRRSGLDALHNLDYDKAQRDFKEIAQLYPTHPAGP